MAAVPKEVRRRGNMVCVLAPTPTPYCFVRSSHACDLQRIFFTKISFNKRTYRDSRVLKIYGMQVFLPRTKIKDARSCRPYRQHAVYACTCRVTSFEAERKQGENPALSKNYEPSAAGRMGGTEMRVTVSMFIKRNFRGKILLIIHTIP